MATDFGVYFREANLPTLGEWQQSIWELAFEVLLMEVPLLEHSGMLPVAFQCEEFNSGFEFRISYPWKIPNLDELRRNRRRFIRPGGRYGEEYFRALREQQKQAVEGILGENTSFAEFRCFSQEWPAAICAAAGFARATRGIFQDPCGEIIVDFNEVIAFARKELEVLKGG